MSVEENKKVHQRNHEEVWMKRNLDAVGECFSEDFVGDMGRGDHYSPDQLKEALEGMWSDQDKNNTKVVRVEHHAKIGEGDLLAVWQTNYRSDGSSQEMVTLLKFKKGKIVSSKWFPAPGSTGQ